MEPPPLEQPPDPPSRDPDPPDVVDELYEEHFPRVYAFLRSLLEDPAEVDDITHEVFEAMLDALSEGTLERVSSVPAWLFGVARHRAADHHRRHRHVDVTPPGEMARRMTEAREPAHHVDSLSAIFDADVAASLRTLPEQWREVILLRYVGDLDLATIAEVLGTSKDAVKQIHSRALARLRERLRKPGSGD